MAESPAPPTPLPAGFVWPAIICVVAAASIAPLWVSQLLPFQDAPQHLASVQVLAHPQAFAQWFTVDLLRLQYLGFYLPAAALAKLFGADAACRLMLSLLALATPAAFWMLLGAFGRDRRLAIFAPALFHTAPLYLGFFNFVESIPLALAVVALFERGSRPVLLAFSAAVLLWLHPSALAWALGACFILGITRKPRRFADAVPFLPAVALIAGWAVQAIASRDGEGRAGHAVPKWLGLKIQILDLLRYGNVLAGHLDELCVALLGLIWAALILNRSGAAIADRRSRDERLPWRPRLLAGLTLLVYLVTPYNIGYMGYIHLRALPFLFFMAIACIPGRVPRWALIAVALVSLFDFAQLSSAVRRFDTEAEVASLREVLAAARPGRKLTAVIYEQGSHLVQFQSYMHFGAYYEIQRGGRSRYNFAETPWTPVRFRKGTEPPLMPRGWELQPEAFDVDRDAAGEDYLLVRGPAKDPGAHFTLRAQSGRWKLFERAATRTAGSSRSSSP